MEKEMKKKEFDALATSINQKFGMGEIETFYSIDQQIFWVRWVTGFATPKRINKVINSASIWNCYIDAVWKKDGKSMIAIKPMK